MIFLGADFLADSNSISLNVNSTAPSSVQLYSGEFKQLHLSTDTSLDKSILDKEFSDRWNENTVMDVDFSTGSTNAGNIEYAEMYTDFVTIKRREVGQVKWQTILAKKVNSLDDLTFTVYDKYTKSNTDYEYSISLFSGNKESSRNLTTVTSDYDGVFIIDKDRMFGTVYNVNGCDTTREILTGTHTLMNDRYPTVVSNSIANYDAGSVEGFFAKIDICGDMSIDKKGSMELREELKDRLAARKPFILKVGDGRAWIVKVTGEISDTMDTDQNVRNISFDWVQIGKVDDMEQLYKCNLSDVDSRWW